MIFRVFGHQAPREPLLFLLWMIPFMTSPTYGAIRSSEDHTPSRNRKLSHTKREDPKVLATTLNGQNDFPYRYVFPANHPFSTFTQYLSPPPSGTAYNYDMHPHQSHTHQQYAPQEFKYVIKQQHQSSYPQTNPPNMFSANTLPQMQGQSSPAPLILLVHAGPSGNSASGPFQTFVLIPADGSNQQTNNLAAVFAGGGPVTTLQVPSAQPYSNVGLPPSANMLLPMTQQTPPPILFRPSPYGKNNQNHVHGLLQRPISVYPMPNHGKYYPQKKNSVERMSEKGSKRQTTSTEANIGYLTTRS